MRFLRLSGIALAAALLAGGTAGAQMATPVPDMKPDFSSMKFLLGTWTCKTLKNTAGRGTGRLETDVYTMSFDGRFMADDSVSKPFDKARTRSIVTRSYTGYDPATKTWVSFNVDNFGDSGWSTSAGWVGNTMSWRDKWNSGGSPLGVATTTKVSDTKTTGTYTTKGPKGMETTSSECTKG